MTLLPGLTSTEKEMIPRFVRDLRESSVRAIALFPTVLTQAERYDLYRDLAAIPGLRIPHVHLRSDFDDPEMSFVADQFNTELFNIHPEASRHPFGPVPDQFAGRTFVENVEIAAQDDELERLGGICPDYSHLENARLQGRDGYLFVTQSQMRRYHIGCCHISGIRRDEPNPWTGGYDHHNFTSFSDFDYMERYAHLLPDQWLSLELENSLGEQIAAAGYLRGILSRVTDLR